MVVCKQIGCNFAANGCHIKYSFQIYVPHINSNVWLEKMFQIEVYDMI